MNNNDTQEAEVVKDDQPQEAVVVAENKKLPAQQTIEPMALIEMALQNDQVDQIEKLMELQERWENRQAEKAYLEALSLFQSVAPDIKKTKKADVKNKEGKFLYSYDYAPLEVIQKAIAPAIKASGLSYTWKQDESEKGIKVTCIVSHVNGHRESTSLTAAADASGGKNAIQQVASTITYLRRYTLTSALGIGSAEDDDDGQQQGQQQQPKGKPGLRPDQLKRSLEKYRDFKITMKEVLQHFKVTADQKKEFRKAPEKAHWFDITEAYKTGDLTAEQIADQFDLTDQQKEQLESL